MAEPNIAPDRIHELFRRQQANRAAIKRTTAVERIGKLERLREAITSREAKIRDAMAKDFRKSPTEVDITEVFPVLVEIKDAIKHLARWMRPQRIETPMSLFGTHSEVMYEPKGVVLIIGPWNYPVQLVLAPLLVGDPAEPARPQRHGVRAPRPSRASPAPA